MVFRCSNIAVPHTVEDKEGTGTMGKEKKEEGRERGERGREERKRGEQNGKRTLTRWETVDSGEARKPTKKERERYCEIYMCLFFNFPILTFILNFKLRQPFWIWIFIILNLASSNTYTKNTTIGHCIPQLTTFPSLNTETPGRALWAHFPSVGTIVFSGEKVILEHLKNKMKLSPCCPWLYWGGWPETDRQSETERDNKRWTGKPPNSRPPHIIKHGMVDIMC